MEIITDVSVRTIEVPLDSPVWLGGYAVEKRDYCFVEITASNGLKGHALTFARGGELASAVVKNVVPVVMGKNPNFIEQLWDEAYQKIRLNGQQGLLMRALSIVDLALWDLKGKKYGAPLYQLLGGHSASKPILMAGGYYAPGKNTDDLCREFESYVDEGYSHLKMMVGGASMQEDLQRFVTVRKALPPQVELAIDANGYWTDQKAVLRWVQEVLDLGCEIAFVEEPLPPENREGLSWLRDKLPVPIASGEFVAGRWAFKEMITRQCMDIVRADTTLCGGITEWRRIASLAASWNLTVIPHYFASMHLHPALAFPSTAMIEVVSQKGKNSSFALLAGESYVMREGIAYPKDLPGLGLSINSELLDQYTTQKLTSA